MNTQWLSGFFDADGYITLVKSNKSDVAKHVAVGFTNTEKSILLEIQSYITSKYNLKGYISTKKIKKENHKTGYDLKYSFDNGLSLIFLVNTIHPKKKHRKKVVLDEYKSVVKRNGKYSSEDLQKLSDFETKFFRE
jgi:hypothetical protein